MKRCPTCKQTFEPHLSFCLDDGTPLVKIEDEPYDPETTMVSPSATGNSATRDASSSRNSPEALSDWPSERKNPVYQQPARLIPPPAASRAWPWAIGIGLVLVVGGAAVAAAILVPKMMRAAQTTNGNENKVVKANINRPADNRNVNTNGNSNSANTNANANKNSDPTAPTDETRVLSDLTAIENDWQAANIEGDKQKLQHILADDYVGTRADGTIQGKADYINDLKPDPAIKHSQFENLKVTLKGDRVTLEGLARLDVDVDGEVRELVLRFTDKYVWRDARWQAVGSEVARVD
jgi:hypothetical protein